MLCLCAHARLKLDRNLQVVLESEMNDEGLHALAVNNRAAERLITGPPDEQRSLILEAIKQADTFLDKVRPSPQLLMSPLNSY
jgi:hypothetical protein